MLHATSDECMAKVAERNAADERVFAYELKTADEKTVYVDAKSKKDAAEQFIKSTVVYLEVVGKAKPEKKAKVEIDFSDIEV